MIPSRLPRRLLTTLFVRSQNNDYIDLFVLSERAGASPYAVLRALSALQDAGLVDARKLRLTLSGLALAGALVGPHVEAPRGAVPSGELAASDPGPNDALSSGHISSSPISSDLISSERAASARHAA